MSLANVMTGHTGPEEPWQPALTEREAAKLEIPQKDYKSAAIHARMAVEENKRIGTARDRWEPTLIQNDHMTAPFLTDGEQELASRLKTEADPALDKAQDLIENVKANLDEITEDIHPIATPESGANYSVPDAVERVGQHDMKIEQEEAAGRHHHRRVSALLQRLASWVPWAMSLLLGDLPGVEQVELDSPRDVGDAGLAGLPGGEVAGFLGFPRAGAARAAAGGEAGHEDLQQERGERVILLVRGKKPRRCPSRRPGRAGS